MSTQPQYVRPKVKQSFQKRWTRVTTVSLLGLAGLGSTVNGGLLAQTSGGEDREATAAASGARTPSDLADQPAPKRRRPEGRIEFRVGAASAEMEVDGDLREAAWTAATPIPLPYETAPGDNAPAPVRTECYLTYDADRLYVGCVAQDPSPEEIRAYISDRDDTGGHDRIIVSVDPFNDARRAFEFGVSALGVQSDAVYDEQSGGSDDSWDAIWSSAGRITDEGYVVEAAIPFRSLRFPDTDSVQTWGFHARREWPRSDRVEMRSMYWDRNQACVLCQANLVTGIEGVSPGLNVELNPTLVARKLDRREDFPSGEIDAGSPDPDIGLDARWSVTTDVALNVTLNPDFSQVEADAPQLDVNNRFALFFPEKRPFFLEGADFFSTPLRAVFTRTVADPAFGTKLTGKVGGNALGAMFALDEINNLLVPGNQGSSSTSIEQKVASAVARFRRDIGASSTVGALYTGRLAADYGNHVAGVDLFVRPFGALSLNAQVLHSETDYPEAVVEELAQPDGAFGGNAAQVRLSYDTRTWFGSATAWARDPDFRADAGFIPQVDVKGVDVWGGRNFWGSEGDFFTRLRLNGGFWHGESWAGRLNGEGLWMSAEYQGPMQSSVWVNPNLRREWFAGTTHEFFQLWSGFSVRPSGTLFVDAWGMVGEAIDFANARKANQVRFNPSLTVRAGRHVDLRGSLSWQRLSRSGEEILTAAVSELRAVYNFDHRTFFRAIVQLRDTNRNPEMHADPVSSDRTNLATQLLFSYKVNPLTVLFLGYSDDRLGLTEPDATRIPLTQRERAFFLKLGYAWRP